MGNRVVALFAGTIVFLSFMQEASAQWVETSGPHGGKVWALAISGPYLFAGTENGGVYVTKDNGDSWSMVSVGLPRGEAVNCLIVSGTNLFAGTSKGIFMSADNGASWQSRNSGLPKNLFVRCLAVIGTRLFAGGGKAGLFSSTDNGITWELRNRGLPEDNDIWCLAVSSSNLFVGTIQLVPGALSRPTTIFLSTDDGASWEKASSGFPSEALLDCLAASGPDIFAGTFLRGVIRYTDKSKKWSPANSGIPETAILSFAANSTDLFIGTSGRQQNLPGRGVFRSTDNGNKWSALNSGLPLRTWIKCLALSEDYLFAATWEGIVWRLPLKDLPARK